MSLPLISIIVPVYKVEQYLPRCIDSMLVQSYKNLEIILIDDGSPDESGRICDEYAQKDSRIRVVHKENGRAWQARNVGLDMASGDFIGFMDSDDFIHPDMYQVLYQNLIKYQLDIVQCGYMKVYDDDPTRIPEKDENPRILSNLEALGQLYTDSGSDYVAIWNKLYKRELFQDIRFTKAMIHDDEFFTYKLLYKAQKIGVIRSRFYYYFQSSGSMIRNVFSDRKMEYADAMEERLSFFRGKGYKDLYILAQGKYCMWLLYFRYVYAKDIDRTLGLGKLLRDKYEQNSLEVIREKSNPGRMRFALRMGVFFPHFFGLLIYHRMFRNRPINPLSRLADFFYLG